MKNSTMRRRLISAWISTVISLSLVLLLVGVGLLVVNAREVGNYFKENLQINVLLKEHVTEEEALRYESKVAAIPGVKATHYISREQGKEEMTRLLGKDFLSVFEQAPIPISIDVNLEAPYVQADSLQMVKAQLSESPLVDEVVYQTSLVDALNENLQKISFALSIMVAALLFISFVLIGNTVRLDLFNRRFSIIPCIWWVPRVPTSVGPSWEGRPCRGYLPPSSPSCCWWAACMCSGRSLHSFSRFSP